MLRSVALIVIGLATMDKVMSECRVTDEVCEFWLDIEHHLTMMDGSSAVYAENGVLKKYHETGGQVTNADPANVIQADGSERQRLVVAVNDAMPGPAIEVYEGQTVIVHVKNKMATEATSIHWHGMHQRGTPFMDGVAYITQCPIHPGQSFTYKFTAYPKGTFWYHSHIGSQLSMGLLAPLIVRDRQNLSTDIEEHIMVLQDWNHDDGSEDVYYKSQLGNYEKRKKVAPEESIEGASFSIFVFHAGLINGKGRYYDINRNHNQAPLHVFNVRSGATYRFRVIAAGNLYPFRVSVDSHTLVLVASDGFEMEPLEVESFIINPGERYDFLLTADQAPRSYYVRGHTLEKNHPEHKAEAIVKYDGAQLLYNAGTGRRACTAVNPCKVANCPFSDYPNTPNTLCINVDQFQVAQHGSGAPGISVPGADPGEQVEDIFLNFAFPGDEWTPASVNGRSFLRPEVSALTQPRELQPYLCDDDQCGEEKVCKCFYTKTLKKDKVYQIILLAMGKGKGFAHPIHMHGHSFHVVKAGFATFNPSTDKIDDNLDIDCGGNPDREKSYCNDARWANSSWGGNNVPGLNLDTAPIKDTVIVPTGGYVVVRIKADNPGVWFMHCHIDLHNANGMALVLNESFPTPFSAPKHFPQCRNFEPDKNTYGGSEDNNWYSEEVTITLLVLFIGACIIIFMLIIILFKIRKAT